MHRTTIYLSEELHDDLKRLAWTLGSTLADLLRYAAQTAFADEFAAAGKERPRFSEIPKELETLRSALHHAKLARDRRFQQKTDAAGPNVWQLAAGTSCHTLRSLRIESIGPTKIESHRTDEDRAHGQKCFY